MGLYVHCACVCMLCALSVAMGSVAISWLKPVVQGKSILGAVNFVGAVSSVFLGDLLHELLRARLKVRCHT